MRKNTLVHLHQKAPYLGAVLLLSHTINGACETANNKIISVNFLYSSERKLCENLVDKLSQLHSKSPPVTYLSDLQQEFWKGTGFSSPAWIDRLNDDDRAFYASQKVSPAAAAAPFTTLNERESFSDADALIVFGGSPSSQKTLVRVKNWALGDQGDYETDIYILKRGRSYLALTSSKRLFASKEERQLDFDFEVVQTKIASNLKKVQFKVENLSDEKTNKAIKILQNSSNPQFPFMYQGRLYVIAGQALTGSSLVYQLQAEIGAEAVCVEKINR